MVKGLTVNYRAQNQLSEIQVKAFENYQTDLSKAELIKFHSRRHSRDDRKYIFAFS